MSHPLARTLALLSCGITAGLINANAQSAFQGFEDPADLTCWAGDGTITRVPSGGGTLHLTAYQGNYYAEITNQDDAYASGFGDSKYTEFCLPPSGYQSDFFQEIAVYINANWAPGTLPTTPGFWIDESPRDNNGLIADGDPADGASVYTAEHNFRLTATGVAVTVGADDQAPFATITTSGWYVFRLTWRKAALPTLPVLSDFIVYNASGTVVGTTTRPAFMVGTAPPLPSANLGGPGYLWFTVWQNHFANDILGIDSARVNSLNPIPGAPELGDLFFNWFFLESGGGGGPR